MPIEVSRAAARLLLLQQQGLLRPLGRAAKKADLVKAIRRMQLLQIDTISVVARSPYLVLHSRLGHYEPRWLEEIHVEGRLFEYWAHAMCWLPAEDWPLFASLIAHYNIHGFPFWRGAKEWMKKHEREVEHVRQRVREEGALRSLDFESTDQRGIWWDWKVEKQALEYLMITGELMIPRRERFQRVYDLTERVRPDWDPKQAVSREDALLQLMRNSASALGVATEPWLRDYYRMKNVDSRRLIAALEAQGELLPAAIEGVKEKAWLAGELLPALKKAEKGGLAATHTALLSPFDPLVWDRRRLRQLYDFDYTIEVYTPEARRKYGYFVLPILHRGELVGRLCPKAHRREGVFELRSLHVEAGVRLEENDWAAIAGAVQDCADWHATPQVKIEGSSAAAKALRAALKQQR